MVRADPEEEFWRKNFHIRFNWKFKFIFRQILFFLLVTIACTILLFYILRNVPTFNAIDIFFLQPSSLLTFMLLAVIAKLVHIFFKDRERLLLYVGRGWFILLFLVFIAAFISFTYSATQEVAQLQELNSQQALLEIFSPIKPETFEIKFPQKVVQQCYEVSEFQLDFYTRNDENIKIEELHHAGKFRSVDFARDYINEFSLERLGPLCKSEGEHGTVMGFLYYIEYEEPIIRRNVPVRSEYIGFVCSHEGKKLNFGSNC